MSPQGDKVLRGEAAQAQVSSRPQTTPTTGGLLGARITAQPCEMNILLFHAASSNVDADVQRFPSTSSVGGAAEAAYLLEGT